MALDMQMKCELKLKKTKKAWAISRGVSRLNGENSGAKVQAAIY